MFKVFALCWAIVFSSLILWVPFIGAEESDLDATKRVLVLNSYHKGYMWSDEITRGIEDVLVDENVDLYIEYLDAKRQYSESYLKLVADVLSFKHQKQHYDLVITTDNIAFDFVQAHRDNLFGDIPVVFCGMNYPEPSEFERIKNVTGIAETADLKGNINLIRKIHPETSKIVVITDNTVTGKRVQQEIRSIQQTIEGMSLELVYDISYLDLAEKVEQLDEGHIVLFTFFFRDNKDRFFTYDAATQWVTSHSNVPVYGAWKFSLGLGIIGGRLTSGHDQGTYAAQKSISILSGVPASEIPILWESPTQCLFDYNELLRANISLAKLPVGSGLINKPDSFYAQHRDFIRNVTFLFFAMLLAIISLSYGLARARRMEQALRKSETKYRLLYEQAPVALFKANSKTTQVLSANPAAVEMLDFDSEEDLLRNMSVVDLYSNSEDRAKILQQLEHFGIIENSEFEAKKRDGRRFWVQYSCRSVTDEISEFYFVDITQRKQAELALVENRKRMREVQAFAKIGSWQHELGKGLTYGSSEVFDILTLEPCDPDELYRQFLENTHPEDREVVESNLAGSYETGKSFQLTSRYRLQTGKMLFLKSWGKTIASTDGSPTAIFGIIQDISQQVQNEKQLEWVNYILDSMREINRLISKSHSVESLVQGAVDALVDGGAFSYASITLTKKPSEISSVHGSKHNPVELFEGEEATYPTHTIHAVRNQIRALEVFEYPKTIAAADPFKTWENQQVVLCPIVYQTTTYGYLSCIYEIETIGEDENALIEEVCDDLAFSFFRIDLEKQRETAVQDLVVEKEKAITASKVKDEFLAVVSHELRTPLNPIFGFVQLMQEDHDREPEKSYLQIILDSANRQLILVNDILEFVALDKGSIELCIDTFNVMEICEEVIAIAKNETPHLKYSIGHQDGFDRVTSDTHVVGDQRILFQILQRMFSNACKYTEEGQVVLNLGIKQDSDDAVWIHFSVEDTGIGIARMDHDILFDPFSQADSSATRQHEGAGIGLAICKKHIDLLGGRIGAKNNRSKGATFWFEVPTKLASMDDYLTEM